MKYLAHVPTESYGFISVEVEGDANEAVAAYKELQGAWKGEVGGGLPAREFCQFFDYYVQNGKPPVEGLEQWERMSARQRDIVNEWKKCLKRINK